MAKRKLLREELARFAGEMERVLQANDYKDSYVDFDEKWLLDRLKDEVGELEAAVLEDEDPEDREYDVQAEALDVANFALFIYEVNRRAAEREKGECTCSYGGEKACPKHQAAYYRRQKKGAGK